MLGSDHAGSADVRDCDRFHGAAPVTAVVWAQEEAMVLVVSLLRVSAYRYIIRNASSGSGRQFFSPVCWRLCNLLSTCCSSAACAPRSGSLDGISSNRLVPLVLVPPVAVGQLHNRLAHVFWDCIEPLHSTGNWLEPRLKSGLLLSIPIVSFSIHCIHES